MRGVSTAHAIQILSETDIIPESGALRQHFSAPGPAESLPLALAARGFLDLSFVLAASTSTRAFGCCLLPCCALYFLTLVFVGDALGICHVSCQSFFRCDFSEL